MANKAVNDWGFRVDKSMIIFFAILSVVVAVGINKFIYCFEGFGGHSLDAATRALDIWPMSFIAAPFGFSFTSLGLGVSFFGLLAMWCLFLYIITKRNNFMRGVEQGSARWGDAKDAEHYIDKEDQYNNIILSQTERMAMVQKTFNPEYDRNKNVCVIGGSGSGKTRFFVKPNLMQLNSSYVLTDPKGTLVPDTGHLFKENGYKVKIFNTINFDKSMHYNPLAYIHGEKDILKLVNVLMENTNGEKGGGGEDGGFWEKAEKLLYSALVAFIHYYGAPHEKNMNTLVFLLDSAKASEENENLESALDYIFRQVEKGEYYDKTTHKWVNDPNREADPDNFAVRQYHKFKQAAGKTLKSILISCSARLAPFDIAELKDIMEFDELELDMIGDEKTILYVVMSDTDNTFGFLVAMMFYQMFNLLCDRADDVGYFDEKKNRQVFGELKLPVQCICDEFANIGKIPNFERLIATIRSRKISACIILQSKSQLDSLYDKDASTIIDNCDTLIFLGGKSTETNEEIAKMIGQTTVDAQNVTDQKGQQGSHSVANQFQGRDLIQAAEIGKMSRTDCLVLISGENPFISKKYDITKHPRYKFIDPGHDGAKFKSAFDAEAYINTLKADRERAEMRERAQIRMQKKARLEKQRRNRAQREQEEIARIVNKPNVQNIFLKAS